MAYFHLAAQQAVLPSTTPLNLSLATLEMKTERAKWSFVFGDEHRIHLQVEKNSIHLWFAASEGEAWIKIETALRLLNRLPERLGYFLLESNIAKDTSRPDGILGYRLGYYVVNRDKEYFNLPEDVRRNMLASLLEKYVEILSEINPALL